MKWFTLCGAIGIALFSSSTTNAGWFSNHGDAKSCDCTMTCQPECCQPVVYRPACPTKFNYQRSCCKPVCCTQTAPLCCAPQSCCAPQMGCDNATCCDDNVHLIAHYIQKSQTACYARQRRRAIDKLGDKFSCACNPEIMCALTYALNDSDHRVRGEAADEIGDQLRKNPCCCNQQVICALTQALGDCNRRVRREAEEALRVAGYKVEDCCANTCCTACAPACGTNYGPAYSPEMAPAPSDDGTPPPAPPADDTVSSKVRTSFVRLATLFR